MKIEEIITEARKYAANDAVYTNIENGATYAKEEIAERACIYGIKHGLKRHAHDYLVTTKQRIEKVKENYKTRIEELEKDKKYFSDSLDKQIEATLKLQQENEKLKEILKDFIIYYQDHYKYYTTPRFERIKEAIELVEETEGEKKTELVDVAIIENGRVIGTMKVEKKGGTK